MMMQESKLILEMTFCWPV